MEETIDQLTVAGTDYKIVQGLTKLLHAESEFDTVAAADPREIRQRLLEKANASYPIVQQPILGEDTQKLKVYSAVADQLGISLEECYQVMYADLSDNKRLVRFGDRVADGYDVSDNTSTTTGLTGDSEESYANDTVSVEWLLTRYNLALAHAVLYDATRMQSRVWDHISTVFSYVKLFGLMHRIYPIDETGSRVPNTDAADGYEAILVGPASLFSQTQKYRIRMANFLPALPLCDRWEMHADILADDTGPQNPTLSFDLDRTAGLSSHHTAQDDFDSDVERMLARKWDRATSEEDLIWEDDVLDFGAEVMLPDFPLEHPDGPQALLEIVGFWTPEYLDEKLAKITTADSDNLLVAVSERLACSADGFDGTSDR